MTKPSDESNNKPSFFDSDASFSVPPPEPPKSEEPSAPLEDFLTPIEPAATVEEPAFDFNQFSSTSEPAAEEAALPWEQTSAANDADMDAVFAQQDYAPEIEEPAPELELPPPVYKAYADYDYGDDSLAQEIEAEQAAAKGIKVSKQAIVFLLLLLFVGGYFAYQYLNPDYSKTASHSKRKREPRKAANKGIEILGVELGPIWDLTRQHGIPANYDRDMINIALNGAGKDNPFTIPGQVVEIIKEAVEEQIEEVKPPEMYKRRAYRAGLIGVLTSGERNLALVSYKEADFEYLQGTKKVKIVKLATKAMSKAKEEYLELLEQDFVGPWQIVKIEAGRSTGKEAYITLKLDKELRTMKVGQALELGIFDLNDKLDVFRDAADGPDEDIGAE